jgi:hypothetical protein
MGSVRTAVFAVAGLLWARPAFSGGSDVQARVISFVTSSNTEYTLVVAPVTSSQPEPYPESYLNIT